MQTYGQNCISEQIFSHLDPGMTSPPPKHTPDWTMWVLAVGAAREGPPSAPLGGRLGPLPNWAHPMVGRSRMNSCRVQNGLWDIPGGVEPAPLSVFFLKSPATQITPQPLGKGCTWSGIFFNILKVWKLLIYGLREKRLGEGQLFLFASCSACNFAAS